MKIACSSGYFFMNLASDSLLSIAASHTYTIYNISALWFANFNGRRYVKIFTNLTYACICFMQINKRVHPNPKQLFMLKLITPTAASALILFACISNSSSTESANVLTPVSFPEKSNPKIQVAILLDVSNSMDGLIDQAKAQLWNMVSVMGKAKCNGLVPQVELALYEYGRSNNDVKKGYVKQINGFTGDLDQVSQNLFKLTTNGGDEYCGHVMYSSLTELNWDTASTNYKVIFIAGNEDFLQGDIVYTKSCNEAKKKGVIINTIYCGNKMQGLQEHWNLGGECGNGSFTNINSDVKLEEIPTPYDSTLFVLNDRLNSTYIYYGVAGRAGYSKLYDVDQSNYSANKSGALKRVTVKGNKALYKNDSWDLVDATTADSTIIAKVDTKTLPDTLKNKSRSELLQIVKNKNSERESIQKEIETVNAKRESFIATEKTKNATKNNDQTLESEIEKIIRNQAQRFNMVIQ